MKFLSKSPTETKKIGKKIAQKRPLILALKGDLGSGKTTFLKGYGQALGVKEKILSPTFLILKKFPIENKNFVHIDCYRIKNSKDLLALGFKKMINKDLIAIEWPERIKDILPENTVFLEFKIIDKNKRKIIIK